MHIANFCNFYNLNLQKHLTPAPQSFILNPSKQRRWPPPVERLFRFENHQAKQKNRICEVPVTGCLWFRAPCRPRPTGPRKERGM